MHDYTDRIMDEESFSFYKESRSDCVYRALTHNNGYGDEIGIVLDRDATNGIYSLSVLCSIKQNEVTCYFDEVEMNIESIDSVAV
jgi:hypothetical protein